MKKEEKSLGSNIFGQKLRQFRKLAGLTQIELSLELGYSDGSSAISQIERGIKGMQQDKLLMLGKVLGVDPAILFSPDQYTDEQARMIIEFYKVMRSGPKHPHFASFKALLNIR